MPRDTLISLCQTDTFTKKQKNDLVCIHLQQIFPVKTQARSGLKALANLASLPCEQRKQIQNDPVIGIYFTESMFSHTLSSAFFLMKQHGKREMLVNWHLSHIDRIHTTSETKHSPPHTPPEQRPHMAPLLVPFLLLAQSTGLGVDCCSPVSPSRGRSLHHECAAGLWLAKKHASGTHWLVQWYTHSTVLLLFFWGEPTTYCFYVVVFFCFYTFFQMV